jgi:mycoredoxin
MTPTGQSVTMYSTSWCGYCRRLKSQFEREGIDYSVVDIEQDPAAADYVMSVNGGNQTVPTILYSDGTAMTNPSITQVREHLATLAAKV